MKKNISIIVFVIISILGFESCTNNKKTKKDTKNNSQLVDSLKYKHLKYTFYIDKFGKLFEKRFYISEGKGEESIHKTFMDSIVTIIVGNSSVVKSLTEVIDINSFTNIDNGSYFSKDKKYVYYSYSNSGGGFRVVVNGANPNTFQVLSDYSYGSDDKHLFYQSKIIQELNFKKLIILYSLDDSDSCIAYIKDDKNVFYNGEILKGADTKTFKLINAKVWTAEDKNYKYDNVGQYFE